MNTNRVDIAIFSSEEQPLRVLVHDDWVEMDRSGGFSITLFVHGAGRGIGEAILRAFPTSKVEPNTSSLSASGISAFGFEDMEAFIATSGKAVHFGDVLFFVSTKADAVILAALINSAQDSVKEEKEANRIEADAA